MKYVARVDQQKITEKHEKTGSLFNQAVAVLAVVYACLPCGTFLGYTSSAIESMKEDVNSFPEISHHDISWIGGLGPLGALVGSLFTLIPLPYLGSRRAIAFLGVPFLLFSWTLIGFSTTTIHIFIGRFLGGTGTGIVIACCPLYVLDVTSIKLRGRLGVMPQFLMILGILTAFNLGSFMTWRNLALSCAVITLPSIFLLVFAPDSPTWLLSKGRVDDAFRTLEILHGTKQAHASLRTTEGKTTIELTRRERRNGFIKRKLDMGMIKASAVALGILSFQQLTGINGVTFYAVSIFRETVSGIDAHVPCIILASSQLIASFASTIFIERLGRKILLIISSTLIAVAGTTLGTYFYCWTTTPYLFWVPLVALIVFVFGFAIGYGPVAWILVAEILPEETRHIMNPLAIAYNWFCVFLVTKSFPLLKLEFGIFGIFWLYTGFAVIGLLFVILFVPETKGKSTEQIRRFFTKVSESTVIETDNLSELAGSDISCNDDVEQGKRTMI